MSRIIRTSRHSLKFTNPGKKQSLHAFLEEYRTAVQRYIDFLWNNRIEWKENRILDVQNDFLDCPRMLDYKIISFETKLSARALSSAVTQACGIVQSKTRRLQKLLWIIEKLKEEDSRKARLTQKRKEKELQEIRKALARPILSESFKAELSSKNIVLQENKGSSFDQWLLLGSVGLFNGKKLFPIKNHRHSKKLEKKGFKRLGSFLLSKDSVEIRWGKEVEKRDFGETIGCDSGVNSVISFSNQENSEEIRVNGWTYSEAVKLLSRKKKGSKNFHRTESLRRCVLNGTINYLLDSGILDNVKQVNLEDNSKLKYKKRTSLYLSRHAYGDIRKKINMVCEELGVRVSLSFSGYKSQRCSACGWTQKGNRKGKGFLCKKCACIIDADINAARNNALDLEFLDFSLVKERGQNLSGFYWGEMLGMEPRVPSLDQVKAGYFGIS